MLQSLCPRKRCAEEWFVWPWRVRHVHDADVEVARVVPKPDREGSSVSGLCVVAPGADADDRRDTAIWMSFSEGGIVDRVCRSVLVNEADEGGRRAAAAVAKVELGFGELDFEHRTPTRNCRSEVT